ncbi:MAG: DUF1974 domain-containing protein, partial [Merismopedia sp. SIO2A8]|nr:DUF1974 domain-containing protein [Merismopedia sp. SIO2A8]
HLPLGRWEQLFTKAVEVGVISVEEAKLVREAESARNDAIQVDAFSLDEYQQGGQLSDRLTREPMVV